LPVTEYERHQLFTWFEEHMGPERAATMMSLVPPVGWADLATKHDLAELETRLEARLGARMDGLESRFDALESRVDSKLDRLRADLMRTFVTWLLLSQAGVIAAVGALLAVM
jgi:hypothetical protein